MVFVIFVLTKCFYCNKFIKTHKMTVFKPFCTLSEYNLKIS
jgi:endogenous inhibitor of DNA gyrase (YacG/DUF329 family)